MFQASLASAVLFNPDHQAHAGQIAAGFAVVLLPYSAVGPFVGVLLDRWWRQRVLVLANLLRALCVLAVAAEVAAGWRGAAFYASALVVVSINRFVLSALSASLPHLVTRDELVSVNAFNTTTGALATALGGGTALALRLPLGGSDSGYGVVALAAALPYVAAGLTARGFGRSSLGPDDAERAARESVAAIWRGLRAGARHLAGHRAAARGLAVMSVVRYCYGLSTVCTLLLFRYYFTDDGLFRAGLAGLGQVVAAIAIGSAVAALLTPTATRRLGFVRWPVLLLTVAALAEAGLGLPFRLPLMMPAAFVLGFTSQALKITVDTLVQASVADAFRGRVFALYDTVFNASFVLAAGTAVLLPADGHAPVAVLVLTGLYLATAGVYASRSARHRAPVVREAVRSAG
jgi:MFS family permease